MTGATVAALDEALKRIAALETSFNAFAQGLEEVLGRIEALVAREVELEAHMRSLHQRGLTVGSKDGTPIPIHYENQPELTPKQVESLTLKRAKRF